MSLRCDAPSYRETQRSQRQNAHRLSLLSAISVPLRLKNFAGVELGFFVLASSNTTTSNLHSLLPSPSGRGAGGEGARADINTIEKY